MSCEELDTHIYNKKGNGKTSLHTTRVFVAQLVRLLLLAANSTFPRGSTRVLAHFTYEMSRFVKSILSPLCRVG